MLKCALISTRTLARFLPEFTWKGLTASGHGAAFLNDFRVMGKAAILAFRTTPLVPKLKASFLLVFLAGFGTPLVLRSFLSSYKAGAPGGFSLRGVPGLIPLYAFSRSRLMRFLRTLSRYSSQR